MHEDSAEASPARYQIQTPPSPAAKGAGVLNGSGATSKPRPEDIKDYINKLYGELNVKIEDVDQRYLGIVDEHAKMLGTLRDSLAVPEGKPVVGNLLKDDLASLESKFETLQQTISQQMASLEPSTT